MRGSSRYFDEDPQPKGPSIILGETAVATMAWVYARARHATPPPVCSGFAHLKPSRRADLISYSMSIVYREPPSPGSLIVLEPAIVTSPWQKSAP